MNKSFERTRFLWVKLPSGYLQSYMWSIYSPKLIKRYLLVSFISYLKRKNRNEVAYFYSATQAEIILQEIKTVFVLKPKTAAVESGHTFTYRQSNSVHRPGSLNFVPLFVHSCQCSCCELWKTSARWGGVQRVVNTKQLTEKLLPSLSALPPQLSCPGTAGWWASRGKAAFWWWASRSFQPGRASPRSALSTSTERRETVGLHVKHTCKHLSTGQKPEIMPEQMLTSKMHDQM